MKRLLLTLVIALFSSLCYSQVIVSYDTIIDMKVYKSYYSYAIKGPVFCIYKLYKGGGDVSRKSMGFTSDLPHYNYSHSGYERGHLVNAEDFAYDYESELATFKYYNCIPLTAHINRWIWKRCETKVRKLSQKDSLLIICGGSDYNGLIPERCWKIVYKLQDGKLLYKVLIDLNGSEYLMTDEFLKKFTFEEIKKLYEYDK